MIVSGDLLMVPTEGAGAISFQWAETRDPATHSTMKRAAPTAKSDPAQDVNCVQVDKPWSIMITFFSSWK